MVGGMIFLIFLFKMGYIVFLIFLFKTLIVSTRQKTNKIFHQSTVIPVE